MLRALALTLLLVAEPRPVERIRRTDRAIASSMTAYIPTFAFLPAPAALASQCTGAALTGTQGEAITFTRSSAQSCSRANGTLVKLAPGQPALEARGVLLEAAGTNYTTTSEQISGFICAGGGANNTQDAATAPDGTLTADRFQFATPTAGSCYQVDTVPSGTTFTASAFASGTVANPSTTNSVIIDLLSGAQPTCTCSTSDGRTCTVALTGTGCGANFTTSAGYVRVSVTAVAPVAHTSVAMIFRAGGASTTSTGDAYWWGMQTEAGTVATSYIPTSGSAATRNSTNLNLPSLTLSSTPSIAATVVSASSQPAATWAMTGTGSSDNLQLGNVDATGSVSCSYAGTTSGSKTHGTALVALSSTRLACYYDGAVLGACVGGVCQTASAAGLAPVTGATTANALGYYRPGATGYASGWLSAVCIDSTSGGCR